MAVVWRLVGGAGLPPSLPSFCPKAPVQGRVHTACVSKCRRDRNFAACVSRRGRTDVRATAGDVDSLTQPPLCSGTTQEEVLPTSQHVLLRSPRLCRRTHTSLRMPAEDLFDDIRSPNAALRYPHENAVLSAAEEILSAQGLQRTPVAYFGVFLMTMQADGEKVTQAVSAAMLALLERAMSSEQVPQRLLLSKGPQIASSLVGVANAHAESVQVLSSALACAARLLSAASVTKQAPTPDTLKLFNWMLAFVVHPSPQVRGKGQTTCRAALEQRPALSDTASRFVDAQLGAAAARKDVELALHLLGFVRSALSAFEPAPLGIVANAIMRQPASQQRQHPVLSKACAKVLVALCNSTDAPPAVLVAIADRPLRPTASPDPGALVAAAAATSALIDVDAAKCHARLAPLTTAWVRGLMGQRGDATGGSSRDADGSAADLADENAENDGTLSPGGLREALEASVRPSMAAEHVAALASALIDLLAPVHASQRKTVLEASAALVVGLGPAASPACDTLLQTMSRLYTDAVPGANRGHVLASLGQAAKSIGPEKFVNLMPIRVSTDGGEDTSWLLSALRNSVGNARLGFFGSYFLPLASWLEARSLQMREEAREVEARNLQNLQEQVWALLPGFCACAHDVDTAFPPIAKGLGNALAEKPEVRGHVVQALVLIVQTARSHKAPVVDASGALVSMGLAPHAQAALDTLGRFGKNFLPLLFNVHQAEPPEKRPALQEAVRAVASATPAETLGELFAALLRKMLAPEARPEGGAPLAAANVEARRGLLDLLGSVAPSLSDAQAGMLARATRPALLSPDVLTQKKAYKLLAILSASHQGWARAELPVLRAALSEALPACASGCKGKRLACLYTVAEALPASELAALVPSLLGEVVLATREVNVKTRAAAYELLVCLAEAIEKRAAGDADRAAALRAFLTMVAGGLAGSTLHMIAASLAALGRLTYELRTRALLEPTIVQLFSTVLGLLKHGAQEVVKSALTFVKVALVSLRSEAVRPLLPQLLPAILVWGGARHPHLKTQVRYVVERLVKRFGYEETASATPEAHQRLLVHLRKQKVRSMNHAAARREEKRALLYSQGMGAAGSAAAELEARRERHAEFEALLDDDEVDGTEHESGKARSSGAPPVSAWVDASNASDGGVMDMLSAPIHPTAFGTSARADPAKGSQPISFASRGAATDAGGGTVEFDDAGKLVVQEAGHGPPKAGANDAAEDMEDDADEEQARASKRRRAVSSAEADEQAIAAADGEDGDGDKARASSQAAKQNRWDERNKRNSRANERSHSFGVIYGDQFASKKGAKGDVLRSDAGSMQPFSYMPLAPKLLGKKHQASAALAMRRLIGVKTNIAGRKGRHGVNKRRGRGSSKPPSREQA